MISGGYLHQEQRRRSNASRIPHPRRMREAMSMDMMKRNRERLPPVLKKKGVSVIMGRSIGANVVRMRRKFAVVVSRSERTDEALAELRKRLSEVQELLDAGEERGPHDTPAARNHRLRQSEGEIHVEGQMIRRPPCESAPVGPGFPAA